MYIYTANDIHNIDRQAEEKGFSLFTLMENAGRSIFETCIPFVNKQDHIVILAGKGNNGGDGIVLARYLKDNGYHITLCFPLGEPKTEIAKAHLHFYKQHDDLSNEPYTKTQPDVIVDALLGVGANPPLREDVKKVLQWANEQQAKRYAIDIPTGVGADDGGLEWTKSQQDTVVFQADITFTLHGAKPSAFLLPASSYYGQVIPVSIGLKQNSNMTLMTKNMVQLTLPKRNEAAHKGTFGTSLLFAGSDNMPGSALLATIGAIRSGTGKLILATSSFAASVITPCVPEATFMFNGLKAFNNTGKLPDKISSIGIGPGLQDSSAVKKALDSLMQTNIPLVIDAGALLKNYNWKRPNGAPTILTPHPREFSRLTGISTENIQNNRIHLAQQFAMEQHIILVLKGQHTVIALPNGHVFLNPTGNTGLAKGGSGDVLTGMITSMLSYYSEPVNAVKNAVYIHGLCADKWAKTNSETTMTASDFHQLLPKVFQAIEMNK